MNNITRFLLLSVLIILLVSITGCGKKEVDPVFEEYFGNALQLKPLELPTLIDPSQLCYELWLVKFDFTIDEDSNAIRIVEDEASLGKFYWNTTAYQFYSLRNQPISDTFTVPGGRNVYDFNVVMITVEPLTDDSIRSNNGLIFYEITDPILPIHGQFNLFDRTAYEVVVEYEALNNSMAAAFMLRTYSDDGDPDSNALTGLWFHGRAYRDNQPVIGQSLYMPIIQPNANFVYEGWVFVEDSFPRPLSTGKFRVPSVQDWDNSHGGTDWYPNVPGEDFINYPPSGFTFPVTLVNTVNGNSKVFITFEPYPDPEPDKMFPFILFDQLLPDNERNFGNEFEMKNQYNRLPEFDAIVLTL